MQNKAAALIKVAGTTIQWQSSQRIIGRVRCQRTRNLDVKRVYESGMGTPMSCSQTPIPSWKQEIFDSCTMKKILVEDYLLENVMEQIIYWKT